MRTELRRFRKRRTAEVAGPRFDFFCISKGNRPAEALFESACHQNALVMSAHVRTPSIVPEPSSETVYLVLDDFGRLGRAYVETDEREAVLESVVESLMTVQYNAPARVVAFNLAEGWSKDVSKEVAREILERARLEQRDLCDATRDFVELHTGRDVT